MIQRLGPGGEDGPKEVVKEYDDDSEEEEEGDEDDKEDKEAEVRGGGGEQGRRGEVCGYSQGASWRGKETRKEGVQEHFDQKDTHWIKIWIKKEKLVEEESNEKKGR